MAVHSGARARTPPAGLYFPAMTSSLPLGVKFELCRLAVSTRDARHSTSCIRSFPLGNGLPLRRTALTTHRSLSAFTFVASNRDTTRLGSQAKVSLTRISTSTSVDYDCFGRRPAAPSFRFDLPGKCCPPPPVAAARRPRVDDADPRVRQAGPGPLAPRSTAPHPDAVGAGGHAAVPIFQPEPLLPFYAEASDRC